MQDVFTASGTVPLAEASRHGLGHLTRVYGSAPVTVAEGADELVRQQRVVIEASRFGIPALVHEECLTGFTAYGATVYPAAIAWGATWDPELVRRMAAAIGRDMAALGVHQGLSPVLDVVRDYRWGRVEETIGEDPYLVAIAGHGLRAGPPVGRRDRDPEALRRLLRLAGRAQPRAGVDGSARAARRHPALVRDGHRARWGRLGDELLLRRRRRPRRRQPLAAHRGAARGVGLRGHGGLRLLGGPVPGLHAPGRAGSGRGRRAGPRGGHRRRAARHPRVRRRAGRAGPLGRARRDARRPRRPTRAPRQGTARPARRRVDPRGVGRARRRGRPRLTGQPGAGPRDRRALGRPARRRHRAADPERAAARCRRRWPWSGRAPTTR